MSGRGKNMCQTLSRNITLSKLDKRLQESRFLTSNHVLWHYWWKKWSQRNGGSSGSLDECWSWGSQHPGRLNLNPKWQVCPTPATCRVLGQKGPWDHPVRPPLYHRPPTHPARSHQAQHRRLNQTIAAHRRLDSYMPKPWSPTQPERNKAWGQKLDQSHNTSPAS